jgi:hypothetical protein
LNVAFNLNLCHCIEAAKREEEDKVARAAAEAEAVVKVGF